MHAAAVGREHTKAPVADLVAKALQHNRAVARQHLRSRLLLAQIIEQIGGRALVEVVIAHEQIGVLVDRPARERADRLAQLLGTTDAIALPKRHRARHPGSGGYDHAIAADLLDPPRRSAEQKDLPWPGLIDHLLVELAYAPPVRQGHRI